MAFQLNYTPPWSTEDSPVNYPDSYWVVTQNSYDLIAGAGNAIFTGWATKADFLAGKSPIPESTHNYTFNNIEVEAFNTANASSPNFTDIEPVLESFALSQDGFFSGASQVS